jgi:cation diffusion facilitator CzcD-associated flavoprotein CzcO
LTQPNVDVVTDRITEVLPHAVVTVGADGTRTEHDVDTIIFGTGFHVTDPSSALRVRDNDGRTMAARWANGMSAHRGITVHGFPNLFFLIGPNTGLGHNSMIYMIESHLNYVMDALRVMDEQGIAEFEVRPDVMATYNARLQSKLPGTVWMSGCASWYLDADGKNVTLWPDFTFRFRHRTRRFNPKAYMLRRHADADAGVPAVAA